LKGSALAALARDYFSLTTIPSAALGASASDLKAQRLTLEARKSH
jgi:hypothetical protein